MVDPCIKQDSISSYISILYAILCFVLNIYEDIYVAVALEEVNWTKEGSYARQVHHL